MQPKLERVSKATDKWVAREAEAAAEAAAAPTLQIRKVEQGAATTRLRQAAALAAKGKDIFGLIAAAAEAGEVAWTESAQAEAATYIQSALRGIPLRFRNCMRFHLLEDRHGARLMTRISNVSNDYGVPASNHGRGHRHCTVTGSVAKSLALLAYCLGQTV